jgi:hypothetical protein
MTISRLLQCAAAAALAMVALGSDAEAYSRAAVKDAQALLKIQTTRFQVGEIYRSDLDLAKYNLLEMQFRAGEVSERSFCSQAKPLLEDTAKVNEGETDPPAWKQELAPALGTLSGSTAKCRAAVTTVARILFEHDAPPYSADALKGAEAAADKAEQSYREQDVTKSDVSRAHYAVLALKLEGRQISSRAYCRDAVPLLAEIRKEIDDEAAIGQRDLGEVIGARQAFYKAEARCAGK